MLEKYKECFKITLSLEDEQLVGLKYQDVESWDSVGHMILISTIEEKFEIMLEPDDIIDFSSFEKGQEILSKYNIVL